MQSKEGGGALREHCDAKLLFEFRGNRKLRVARWTLWTGKEELAVFLCVLLAPFDTCVLRFERATGDHMLRTCLINSVHA